MQPSCSRPAVTTEVARRRHSHAASTLRHRLGCRTWSHSQAGRKAADSLADIPLLCDEIERLDAALSRASLRNQNLAAAARATLAADAEGEPDPLYYLRDELAASQRSESQPW
jgi:hypothetical protein